MTDAEFAEACIIEARRLDDEGAEGGSMLRRAALLIHELDRKVAAYADVIEAGRRVSLDGWAPPEYSPQWRARAERAEARVAEAVGALSHVDDALGAPEVALGTLAILNPVEVVGS